MSNFSDMDNVFIMDHPLIQHKISILRNKETGTNEFRKLIEEIAVLMGFEALRDLPLEDVEVETPIETCRTPMISGKKLAVVPVLRAGLGMVNGITTLVPSAKVICARCPAGTATVCVCATLLYWYSCNKYPQHNTTTATAAIRALHLNTGKMRVPIAAFSLLLFVLESVKRAISNSIRSFCNVRRFSSDSSTQSRIRFSSSTVVLPLKYLCNNSWVM